jgi:SAM-dependent methyltransferase
VDRHAWDKRYAATDRLWSAGPNQFVESELHALPPGRALDLAAGEGRNAIWLSQRGFAVEAVDFSAVALERGRAIAHARKLSVGWHEADLASYVPTPGGYELVLIAYLQLPWAQLAGVLERAAAAVARGGTFLLIGHDRQNLEHGHGGPSDPDVLYTPEQIAAVLRGLEIERAQRVERVVQTDAGARTAIDCLVRAQRPLGPTGPHTIGPRHRLSRP